MAILRCEDLMTRNPRTCSPTHTLLDAVKLMKELNVGYVPICGQDERLLGVLTDRDVAMSLANDQKPSAIRCQDAMTRDPITCRPDDDAFECARRMEEHQVRRIPVVDQNMRLVGVIAMADIARKSEVRKELEGEVPSVVQSVSRPTH